MSQAEAESRIPVDELYSGLADIKVMLTRLCKGDTTQRAVVNSEKNIVNELKELINQLADHVEETSDYAHNLAIGLCEHYDTLNRIAVGDFSARAAVDSENEVVAKLGELINVEADTLTAAISRFKQAEEDNRTQLGFVHTLIDTIPSPIFYKDASCRYLGCNKAFEAYVGFSQAELVGKTPHELWANDLADRYLQQDQSLINNPGMQVYETSVVYADGTLRNVIFNKATFNEKDGSVGGLVGVILDITELKQASDALAFQNVLLSTQREASLDGLLVVDEHSKIISYNRRFVEMMEIPSHLLEIDDDEPILKYVTGRMADPHGFLAKVRYLYKNPHEHSRDEIVLGDGTVLDRYTTPLLSDDGRCYGRLWSFRDITERKVAEDEVKDAYQRMHDIVEFLPDATFVVDKEKRVIAWNRAIEKMTGLKKEDVLGRGDYIYATPFYGKRRPILIDLIFEDTDSVRQSYAFIDVMGRTLFAETYIPSLLNGDGCYLSGTAAPLFDKHGATVGAIESIRDITEYKRTVEAKSRVEEQLSHARMMESFMVRLGHDLKTPLTPLFILLPLIKKQLAGPELIKKVDMCIKSSLAIHNLADKARTLAMLSTTAMPLERVGVSLASIVECSLADSKEQISQKNIDFRNSVDPLLVVRVVPDQMSVLFANLISNAVRFSGEHGSVAVSAERHATAVVVSVQDSGVGLSPDHLEHVFEEFYKADESRHDINSSGLGLAICKQIVQNHHGRIWAESSGIGKGTIVTFTINEHDTECGYDAKESK
ncbi:MAG: PAS domain-containing protein [Desulfuromonadaceae bacterium]|nr:PAS domain-containing protein [Desulfuromonadaceae bacterium]MDD2847947.1 PAS domain-containing protein [Desulfuromonadaceae bacterium]MDD4131311.1 PAS domain-containing protein [Desulfuromonadaceae bacterium]